MALIKCPECGKEISDKAAACPHCGCPVPVSGNAHLLQKHGSSVAVEKHKSLLKYIIFVVFAVIAAIFFFYNQKQAADKAARAEYISNVHSISDEMLAGAAEAEDVCNTAKSVWYNAIFEKSSSSTDKFTKIGDSKYFRDFDSALNELYSDDSFSEQLGTIRYSQTKVSDLMSAISDPPEGLDKCYDAASKTYDLYTKLTNLALSPTGSLETYSSNFSSYDADFIAAHNSLGATIPKE